MADWLIASYARAPDRRLLRVFGTDAGSDSWRAKGPDEINGKLTDVAASSACTHLADNPVVTGVLPTSRMILGS